jgi:hypothetical protein
MDGSHVASVTVAGRTTRTLATDMTIVVDNSRREFYDMLRAPMHSYLSVCRFFQESTSIQAVC